MPTGERRVVRAVNEAQDPHDETQELLRFWERARADGLISASEMMEVHIRLRRLLRECQEAVLVAEWADAGERRAAGYLLGEVPAHVERYERSILRRADELGFSLLPDNIVPFPGDGEPIGVA